MATTTQVTLQLLIDDALGLLARNSELPATVAVGATAPGVSGTTLTLASSDQWGRVNVSDVLEYGLELMLVTGKSADATPVFTVSRAYRNTTQQAINTGALLSPNPQWSRFELSRGIQKCLRGPLTASLPAITSTVVQPTTNQFYVSLPATTIKVLRVAYQLTQTVGTTPVRSWRDVSGWQFEDDVPTSLPGVSTGKLLTIPARLAAVGLNAPSSVLNLYITYQTKYAWAIGVNVPANESDTVDLPLGGEDLPSIYAAAYAVAGRELSRLQVDKVEEWNHEASVRQGVNLRMVSMFWQEFYRRLDEARRIQTVPRHRPYRKMSQV